MEQGRLGCRPRGPPASMAAPMSGTWDVSAIGPHPGRGKIPPSVTGTGQAEIEALRDLNDLLRGVPRPDGGRVDELRPRLRLANVAGSETWAVENVGRRPDAHELEAVVRPISWRLGQRGPTRARAGV